MREIKFKGWHKVDGWCGAFSVHQTGLIDYGSGWMTPEEANMILLQYTGIKDSNGKEIYEGDIVEVKGRKYGIVRDGERAIVKFSNAGFVAESIPPDDWDPMAPTFALDLAPIEVIGNIYENSNLL